MAVCGNPKKPARHNPCQKMSWQKSLELSLPRLSGKARKKCPDLVLVPPNHDEYSMYSKLVNKIYLRYTDMVEPFGIDESWLDVTGSTSLFGNGKDIADTLRDTVKRELGLTISVGVSFNKAFAKLGSDMKKPDATTIISRDNFRKKSVATPCRFAVICGQGGISDTCKVGNNKNRRSCCG
ncbi:MAG: DNA polymerase Y family protein [Eubacteriales bacterium]